MRFNIKNLFYFHTPFGIIYLTNTSLSLLYLILLSLEMVGRPVSRWIRVMISPLILNLSHQHFTDNYNLFNNLQNKI